MGELVLPKFNFNVLAKVYSGYFQIPQWQCILWKMKMLAGQ